MNYKEYLALAIPFIISTVTQPLLGAVDTAVIGRLDHPSYIGGVAIGAVIFNTLYWLFGFLRVSTSGFSAQSLGSQQEEDRYYAYFRPVLIALIVSSIFIALQGFIRNGAMYIYNPEPDVMMHAVTYFKILIWGVPFVLIGYVNLGWLMGRKYVKETLFLQVSTNVLNIILDIVFVIFLRMGVAGVAYATLISQLYGFAVGNYIIFTKISIHKILAYQEGLFDKTAMKKIMGVNADLMIRTVCLLTMTNMFIAKGTELGTVVLAANAVLYQIQYIISYIFEGLANASSIFAGKCVGENNIEEYRAVLSISNLCTAALSIMLAAAVVFFKDPMISVFTNLEEVVSLCEEHVMWLVVFPLVIGIGMVYYGIFTGSTYTAPIRNSMMISLAVFAAVYFTAIPQYKNHGLWLAFILFSLTRSVVLFLYRKKLFNKVFVLANH
ncbi:multidrug resistance protein, MATE family [Geosporobacter subterraneus DSM 17957]|uniref:Probable multidrug resistance protein NorM n=1 Tax=Geosporobacter subterraneus DSM 17957 TaxID=1121919 RepID=A0A1M6QA56_9FIRM|nr:MATE family efflux transporter [Geosporobacter subterraneus]SHK17035.1 multidrug resistance protein, MATE family [Geosporobacter subterraneus DSM 17957]